MNEEQKNGQVKILVVDDEEAIRETLDEFLTMKGFQVAKAAHAQEALQIIEENSFDVILTDLIMPRMNGISLTKAAREINPDAIIIVMTAYASIDHAVESMKAGAFDFIAKPFNFEHIIYVINRSLETRQLRNLAGKSEYFRQLSITDSLTEIWNYRHFQQNLENEIQRHSRYKRTFSLMFIDIDDFKLVNDKHGHLVGDSILAQLAELLKKCLRGFDFLARYGGEEFVIILPETSDHEALAVGKRILATVASNRFITVNREKTIGITVTIGMSTFPQDAGDKTGLIEKADAALYQGKEAGKNCLAICGPEIRIIINENGDNGFENELTGN